MLRLSSRKCAMTWCISYTCITCSFSTGTRAPCTDEEIGQKGSAKLCRVPPAKGYHQQSGLKGAKLTRPLGKHLFFRPRKPYNTMMPVLDCHTHIFPPEAIRRRERIAGDDKGFAAIYGDGRARMVDAEGLAEYMDREGVDPAAAGCFPFRDASLLRLANDYVLDAAKKDRRIMPFILVDRYDEAKALDEARRCFELGAAGVGEIAWYDAPFGASERKNLDALAAYMEQTGMALLMHLNEPVGHRYPGKTEADFREVAILWRPTRLSRSYSPTWEADCASMS